MRRNHAYPNLPKVDVFVPSHPRAYANKPEQEELQSRPGHFLQLNTRRSEAKVGTSPDAQPWRQGVEA